MSKKKLATTTARMPVGGLQATITFSPELLAFIAKHHYVTSGGYATEEGVRQWIGDLYARWKADIDAQPTLEEMLAKATWQPRETSEGER